MPAIDTFSSKLRTLRKRENLQQGELAQELGVSRGSISFYENGDRVPDIEFLSRVSTYFNVSADWLLGLSETESRDADIRRVCDFTDLPQKFVEEYLWLRDKDGYGNELINSFLVHPAFWDAMVMMYAANALPVIKSGDQAIEYDFLHIQEIVSEMTGGVCSVANTGYLLSGMMFEASERLETAFAQSIRHGKEKVVLHGYVNETELLEQEKRKESKTDAP